MDYWASLEHHLKYKTENDVSDSLKCRLKHDADLLSAIDADLQDVFCQMNAKSALHSDLQYRRKSWLICQLM